MKWTTKMSDIRSNDYISNLKVYRKDDDVRISYDRNFDGDHRDIKLVKSYTGINPETEQKEKRVLEKGASLDKILDHAEFMATSYTIQALVQKNAYENLPQEEKDRLAEQARQASQANTLNASDFADLELPQQQM